MESFFDDEVSRWIGESADDEAETDKLLLEASESSTDSASSDMPIDQAILPILAAHLTSTQNSSPSVVLET